MFGLTQIQMILIGGALAVVLTLGGITYIYKRGENAGASDVKAKVATETVKTLDASRLARERAEQETRDKPYGERVDGLK